MRVRISDARWVDTYRIWLRFEAGDEGEVDLKEHLWGPVFEPLLEIAKFRNFELDDITGTLSWDTGADFAPEFLYDLLKRVA
ncbi:DUF2442 domain-containing protein [Myxococcota bacterium]|nr:DUF2442 domain-containing protein [Myxococcota bacterium]